MADKKGSLLQIIEDQKLEIDKYKSKLRDVVAAHRNLIKEKEALEQSLNVLTASAAGNSNETEDAKQVAALVGSLNTVTAAKAALESSLLADNKALRDDKFAAEKARDELAEKVITLQREADDWKAKMLIERHERDKDQADHGAVMKELQALIAAERQQRMEAEAVKDKNRDSQGDPMPIIQQYKRELERAHRELERTRRRLEVAERAALEPPLELVTLQEQVQSLQAGHEAAIQRERQRTQYTEERAKKHALAQETRIINLENRLAELSHTVGTYDKLRVHHEAEISELRQKIASTRGRRKEKEEKAMAARGEPKESGEEITNNEETPQTVQEMPENNNELVSAVAKDGDPSNKEDIHGECGREINRLKEQLSLLEQVKEEGVPVSESERTDESEAVAALLARMRAVSSEAANREARHARDAEHWKHKLKAERAKAREMVQAVEADWRGRLHQLEGQLEKLRDRSVAMLREKDQQILQIQTSLHSVLPSGTVGGGGEVPWHGPRMLHYANEVARRDVEMAALRRAKHNLEAELRDQQRDMETLRQQITGLHDEIARLSRCQERGGANMEYLKNVVLNFLMTADPSSKRHMCNAIAAVLKLTQEEQDRIAKQPHNTWYTPTT